MHISSNIQVTEIPNKGRGVLALIALAKNTTIECSPVIVMNADARKLLDQTLLHDYIFIWGEAENECCMAQGYISIYNHAIGSNCEYFMDYEHQTIAIKTVRNIDAGEELTINYNGDWDSDKEVWFDMKD